MRRMRSGDETSLHTEKSPYTARLLTHCRQEREENVTELGKDVHSQGVHHLSCGCYGNSLVAESTLSTLPKKSLCHLYIADVYHEYYTLFIASFPGPSRQL